MDECFDFLGDCIILYTLEFKGSYRQIEGRDRNRNNTAFASHQAIFLVTRMQFRLSGRMQNVLRRDTKHDVHA